MGRKKLGSYALCSEAFNSLVVGDTITSVDLYELAVPASRRDDVEMKDIGAFLVNMGRQGRVEKKPLTGKEIKSYGKRLKYKYIVTDHPRNIDETSTSSMTTKTFKKKAKKEDVPIDERELDMVDIGNSILAVIGKKDEVIRSQDLAIKGLKNEIKHLSFEKTGLEKNVRDLQEKVLGLNEKLSSGKKTINLKELHDFREDLPNNDKGKKAH